MSKLWPHQSVGGPEKPAVVLLHGFMGSGADWGPVAKALGEHLWCIAPDLPGHGACGAPPADLGFETLSEGLMNLLDGLGLARAHLLGYSMGGRVALHAALRHPTRIDKLVLEGTNPGLVSPEARRDRAALDEARAETIRAEGLPGFLDTWYRLPFFQSLTGHQAVFEAMMARRLRNDPASVASVIAAMSPGRQPAARPHLKSLTKPVMLIAGSLDTTYARLSAEMASQMPQAQATVIPNAGHNVHLEQPERFVEAVLPFLLEAIEDTDAQTRDDDPGPDGADPPDDRVRH